MESEREQQKNFYFCHFKKIKGIQKAVKKGHTEKKNTLNLGKMFNS